MTLVIRSGETQRAFVERVLREQGRISTHEAMFALVDEAGYSRSVTRLAPVIETLRKAGWDIVTDAPHGQQAIYIHRPAKPLPEWQRGWTCQDCRSVPATEPIPLLGELGEAHCATCGVRRYFRRVAA